MTPSWWAARMWELSPPLFLSWVFWVIFSVIMHELSHGWAALRAGDPTPRATGHMTWNPLVHMGGYSLLMFAIVGMCWGAMPVNPYNFRRRHDDAVVAAAGPSMNLGLGLASSVLAAIWLIWAPPAHPGEFAHNVFVFLRVGAAVNVSLMILNLFPVPPLDGSKILASFIPAYRNLIYSERGPMISMVGIIIVFYVIGGQTMGWAIGASDWIIHGIVSTVHQPRP